jgi:DNA-binding transcriptional LysR family regulator
MNSAGDLVLFVEIVDAGGLTAASRRTGIPKSRLSRRLSRLEADLGVHLVHRDARRFSVTDIGMQIYECGATIRAQATTAEDLALGAMARPSGTLRVACPMALVQAIVGAFTVRFAAEFPGVNITLHTTHGDAGPPEGAYDIYIQPSASGLVDSGMVAQKIVVAPYALVASPALLDRIGRPRDPAALNGVDAIGWKADGYSPRWRLTGPRGRETEIATRLTFSTDHLMVVEQAALQGLGIARVSARLSWHHLERGDLELAMPGWAPPALTVYALVPSRKAVTVAGRLYAERLAEALKSYNAAGLEGFKGTPPRRARGGQDQPVPSIS